jgi:photosystem II stability/assembly factor-like uncharacterized protein
MKRTLTILLLAICLVQSGVAQKLDMELFKNMKPRSIGPAGMSGRITAIDVVVANPDIMYAGAASGGVWKSTNGGINWEPIFDNETTSSIGAIAIQQSNPSVIWVGTGEGNPRNSLNGGDGVYRTLDGGKTWKHMGLQKTRHIHRVIIDPNNPDVVYVGAIGSPWGEHEERGVYKTTDGGKSWKRILFTNIRSGCAELVMDPSNPNKLMAAMWEHKRDPWYFHSGGVGSGLYVSHDGGETWEKRTDKDGLPSGELGRIGIAIAPSHPNIVYALVESNKNALYKSTDGGVKWTMINDKNDIGNRPFYYYEIYVDPINENRIYSIFTYVNVSEDGGKSFTLLMPAYNANNGVHPDHHAWWIHPTNPNLILDGNDGGLNISRDRGKSWQFADNIPVGQFYHVAVDNEFPYNIYGGMQDNGSWVGPAYVFKDQGIRNSYWQEISFGDGFDVLPDPENPRYGISTAQQGFAAIYDRQTGYNENVRPTNPESDIELRFNWNVGMARDPFNPAIVYFGSQFVHKSTDRGQNWTIISPDLTTNDASKLKQGDSGGLTLDATGAENHCTIIVIEPSPIQKDLIWVGTDDGQVQITTDGGKTWKNVAGNIPGLPKGSWIPQIKPSNKKPGEALLVANDYRRFNYTPYAYRTRDFGQTWERIVDQNKVLGYTLAIVEDPVESRLLFLGTDDGLYISIDAGANWTKWTQGFPTTNAYDLIIHPTEHDLVIGTFGRSIYVLDDIRPLRELARLGSGMLSRRLKAFTPPTAYVVATQQPTGSRFGADALYAGENRKTGAMLTYYISKPDDKKPEVKDDAKAKGKPKVADTPKADEGSKVKYDSLVIELVKGNEVIRTLKSKAPDQNGFHRTYWNLDEKGVRWMSRNAGRGGHGGEPGGVTVLPGKYKVRFKFGDQKDSTEVEVKHDPRLGLSNDVLLARYQTLKSLEQKGDLGVRALERIRESIGIVENYQRELKAKDKTGLKEQLDLCKKTLDKLNEMMDVFVGKEDKRQGITRSQTNSISVYYSGAYRYTSNALHAPGDTELKLIAKFESELAKAIEMVNAFYNIEWPGFRSALEQVDLSPFKDYEDLK